MKVTSQDLSPFPYYLPPLITSHLALAGIYLLGDADDWNEILFALTTECGLTKEEIDNLTVGELHDYLKVCNKVLSKRAAHQQQVEREIESARARGRRRR